MSWESWTIFARFRVVVVTKPGPNHLNRVTNMMTVGIRRGLWGVAAIPLQSKLFLTLSAAGATVLIAASPVACETAKLLGAGGLIWLGIRGWIWAKRPIRADEQPGGSVFGRAFMLATINPKSVAGYLAALGYTGFNALCAGLGRAALEQVFSVWLRRMLGAVFVIYGVALGSAATPGRV